MTGLAQSESQPLFRDGLEPMRASNCLTKCRKITFASFVSVPLVSRGCLVGVINVQNREPYHYSQREILLSMVGFLLGAEVGMARLEEQNAKLSLRLESRTLVERAKGILQRELGITESAAYQRLQRQSQQMRKSMKEIAIRS